MIININASVNCPLMLYAIAFSAEKWMKMFNFAVKAAICSNLFYAILKVNRTNENSIKMFFFFLIFLPISFPIYFICSLISVCSRNLHFYIYRQNKPFIFEHLHLVYVFMKKWHKSHFLSPKYAVCVFGDSYLPWRILLIFVTYLRKWISLLLVKTTPNIGFCGTFIFSFLLTCSYHVGSFKQTCNFYFFSM